LGWALLFAFSLLDDGGAALVMEAGATGAWLVETAASCHSANEVFGIEDWLVETAAPDCCLKDVGPCAGVDDVPHRLMSPIIDADKSSSWIRSSSACFGPTSLGYPSSKHFKSING
jgi:hypothetical protein